MPFIASVEGSFGYGRTNTVAAVVTNTIVTQLSAFVPYSTTTGDASTTTDSSGNVYVLVSYTTPTTASFPIYNASGTNQTASSYSLPGTTSASVDNICLIKYNPNGEVVWATYFTTTSLNSQAGKVVCDSSNNIYIVGTYQSSSAITLRDVSGTSSTPSSYTIQSSSGQSGYLVKYNSSGVVQWATYLGLAGETNTFTGVAVYSTNLYITGSRNRGGVTTGISLQNVNGTGQTSSLIKLPGTTVGTNAILLKYDTSGIAQWATYIPTTSAAENISCIEIGGGGFPIIVGNYNATAPVTLKEVSGNGQQDSVWSLEQSGTTTNDISAYIIEYSGNIGNVVFATTIKSNIAFTNRGTSVVVESSQAYYVTGQYRASGSAINLRNAISSSSTQSNSTVTLPTTPTTGSMFIVKYNRGTNLTVAWATNTNGAGGDIGFGLAINKTSPKFLYTVGSYTSSAASTVYNASGDTQVPSSIILPSTINSSTRMFIIKYSLDGIAQCATFINSFIAYYGVDIALFNNNLYVAVLCTNLNNVFVTMFNANGTTQTASVYTITNLGTNIPATALVKYVG